LKFEQFRAVVWLELHQLLFLASATRTFDQQNALYDNGRGNNGPIITNARAGQSWHNFGLAFDVAIRAPNMPMAVRPLAITWDITESIGKLGEEIELEWGQRWKRFPDNNHFQFVCGLTLADALKAWPNGWLA